MPPKFVHSGQLLLDGRNLRFSDVTRHVWAPEIDPAHPLACTQAERYVLRRLDNGNHIALQQGDQSLLDVSELAEAHAFHTQEAALPAAIELHQLGAGDFDVVQVN